MNATTFAIVIGSIVFIVIIVAAIIYVVRKGGKAQGSVVKQSFERADLKNIGEDERLKRSEPNFQQKKPGEGRGRFYAFGLLITAILGTLAVRLWSLQIVSSEEYVEQANTNMTSTVSLEAKRGRILDRNGVELVTNRSSLTVMGKRAILDDGLLIHRLSLVLGIPKGIIRRNLMNDSLGYTADRVIARDVPMRTIAYIKEHPAYFEGVGVETHTVRTYPQGNAGAHILGYTGTVTEADLEGGNQGPVTYRSGDIIGKDGAELAFENVLQGIRGSRTYRVDVDGNTYETVSEAEPIVGNDVCLTVDIELQKKMDYILAETLSSARSKGYVNATAGALICMDVKDGGILAASSYPTFNPEDLIGGISTDLWAELNNEASGHPLTNRVIAALYPAASTFKAFTGLVGMQYGFIADGT
jgi:penicillin-binding protein 2